MKEFWGFFRQFCVYCENSVSYNEKWQEKTGVLLKSSIATTSTKTCFQDKL